MVSQEIFREGVRVLCVPLDLELIEQICDFYEQHGNGQVPYTRLLEAIDSNTYDPERLIAEAAGSYKSLYYILI